MENRRGIRAGNALSLVIACSGAACAGQAVSEATTEDPVVTTTVTDSTSGLTFDVMVAPPQNVACPSDRMIGVRSAMVCPDALASPSGLWTKSALFDGPAGSVPVELMRFCLYEWAGTTPVDDPDTSKLPTDGHPAWSSWLAPDCHVVGALASDLADLYWDELRDAYFAQIERLNPLPAGAVLISPTRVEVIDSSVTQRLNGNPGDGQSEHGRTVALVIDRLACPYGTPSCAAFISNTLALDLERMPSGRIAHRPNAGGYFGHIGGTAAAIFKAVDRWRALAPNDHLVINSSIGWDASYGGAYNGDAYYSLGGPARAVHAAITYAACEGALVIAAAGNDTGGPAPSTGPMYPAAWETKPAPTAATCAGFSMSSSGVAPAGSPYAALLYSAGGVDGGDAPLANVRVLGRPRLAAPSAFVVAVDGSSASGYSDVLTGSSISAAGASAAAAVVWSYRPSWSRFQVMQAVYSSGVDLAVSADYQLGTTPQNIHRISICRAVQAACSGGGALCPAAIDCPTAPAYRDLRPGPINIASLPISAHANASSLSYTRAVGYPCHFSVDGVSAPPLNPCIRRQYYDTKLVPWVAPQPEVLPCNVCVLKLDTLIIPIDKSFSGVATYPLLTLELRSTGAKVKIDLSSQVSRLIAGDTVKVSGLRYSSTDVKSGTIDFLIDGEATVTNQLAIW